MRACWQALLSLCAALALPAQAAPKVQLNGMLGARAALLLIDGEARTLQVGTSALGVTLLALEDGRAVVDIDGRRQTLTLGAAPASVAPSTSAPRQIVMSAGHGGHYTTAGTINGHLTQFLLDTGATSIAISQIEADRMGLRYQQGRRIVTQTANGAVPAYALELSSVRIADVEVRNVAAIVIPTQMPYVLLGNSFLSRFQMRRENDVMTLELRY